MGAVSAFDGISSYEQDQKFYIKSFLLDDSVNGRKWQVTREAMDRDLQSFIGKPFVTWINPATNDFDHPDESVQENYRRGSIIEVGVDKTSGRAYAVSEIFDPTTIRQIKEGVFGFVSPSVGTDEETVQRNASTGVDTLVNFHGYHLAGVTRPAYGVYKAGIKGHCTGTEGQCTKHLKMVQASLDSSHEVDNDSNQHTMGAIPEPQVDYSAKIADLSAKLDSLTQKSASLETENTTLKSQLEAEIKRPHIERILTARAELGEIKAEEKQAEAEKLSKMDLGGLQYIASIAESAVKAKKEAVIPTSVNYRFHRASADSTEKLGDKELLAIRRGF